MFEGPDDHLARAHGNEELHEFDDEKGGQILITTTTTTTTRTGAIVDDSC